MKFLLSVLIFLISIIITQSTTIVLTETTIADVKELVFSKDSNQIMCSKNCNDNHFIDTTTTSILCRKATLKWDCQFPIFKPVDKFTILCLINSQFQMINNSCILDYKLQYDYNMVSSFALFVIFIIIILGLLLWFMITSEHRFRVNERSYNYRQIHGS
jgi:hypothetical protein